MTTVSGACDTAKANWPLAGLAFMSGFSQPPMLTAPITGSITGAATYAGINNIGKGSHYLANKATNGFVDMRCMFGPWATSMDTVKMDISVGASMGMIGGMSSLMFSFLG